jgi:teichuronic acid biosynthesis glycosyltransferase TuaC
MRILAITNIYPTSENPTSGTFVEQQIKGLRRIGLDVDIMFVERAKKGMHEYAGLGRRVIDGIERLQPDLVHTMYGGIMAYQVTKTVTRIPQIVTFHGSDLLGERLSGNVRRMISALGVRASWAAARRATGVVTVSEALKNALPGDVSRRKIHVIPCGIDIELFKPSDREECRMKLGWRPGVFHILFPANSGDPVKRPQLARAAIEVLSQRGVPVEMHYLRGVPYKDVPIWLNASDALLVTSLQEGSPTVVKEALACDLPVVSVKVGDVSYWIEGVHGCYLASPVAEDLAAKLLMVYSGPRRVQGRERVAEVSIDRIASRIETFYRSILSSVCEPQATH